eukprot:Opistho-2@55314
MAESRAKDEDLDRIVLGYLQKKGYKQAEESFRKDAKVQHLDEMVFNNSVDSETSVSDLVGLYNDEELFPDKVADSYSALRDWVSQSLDMYKGELSRVLYPLFVHCYLDLISKNYSTEALNFLSRFQSDHLDIAKQAEEISRLRGIVLPDSRDSEVFTLFRRNKYEVRMSAASIELLVSFLQERNFMLLLSQMNQYVGVRTYEGRPQHETEADAPSGIVPSEAGHSQQDKALRSVHWGVVEEPGDQRGRQTHCLRRTVASPWSQCCPFATLRKRDG